MLYAERNRLLVAIQKLEYDHLIKLYDEVLAESEEKKNTEEEKTKALEEYLTDIFEGINVINSKYWEDNITRLIVSQSHHLDNVDNVKLKKLALIKNVLLKILKTEKGVQIEKRKPENIAANVAVNKLLKITQNYFNHLCKDLSISQSFPTYDELKRLVELNLDPKLQEMFNDLGVKEKNKKYLHVVNQHARQVEIARQINAAPLLKEKFKKCNALLSILKKNSPAMKKLEDYNNLIMIYKNQEEKKSGYLLLAPRHPTRDKVENIARDFMAFIGACIPILNFFVIYRLNRETLFKRPAGKKMLDKSEEIMQEYNQQQPNAQKKLLDNIKFQNFKALAAFHDEVLVDAGFAEFVENKSGSLSYQDQICKALQERLHYLLKGATNLEKWEDFARQSIHIKDGKLKNKISNLQVALSQVLEENKQLANKNKK